MDLREFTKALRRRWLVALFVVAIAAGAGWGMAEIVGPRYSAVTTAVLIPPKSTVDAASEVSRYAPPNPLLYLGGLSQARDLVIRKLEAREVADHIGKTVPGADFEVAPDVTSSGPIIVATAYAGSPGGALKAMTELEHALTSSLQEVQKDLNISGANAISMLILTADTQARVERKQQLQLAVLTVGAILVTGLLLLALLDGLLEVRGVDGLRRRREPPTAPLEPDATLTVSVGEPGLRSPTNAR